MLARHNQLVETLRAPIDATACLVGGIKVRTLASILMSVLKDHTGAYSIRGVSIRKARTVAAACLVGEIKVCTLASILMSVLKDHTGAHPIRGVSIRKARIDATACLVGGIKVRTLASILTNVLKDVTVARPTHTASIHRDHIDVTATGVTINLEVAVMVCISPLRKFRTILDIVQKPKCNNCFVIHSKYF